MKEFDEYFNLTGLKKRIFITKSELKVARQSLSDEVISEALSKGYLIIID